MKKLAKNVLWIAVALVMMLSIAPMVSFAETSDEVADAEAIAVGDEKVITASEDAAKYFKFVPTQDGQYIFESSYGDDDELDPTGDALKWDDDDEEYYSFADDDDGGAGSNFRVRFEATAGNTYILKAGLYSGSGSYKVALTRSTITGISFTPADPYEIVEGTNGYIDDDDDIYFRYYIPAFKDNDKLTVVTESGNVDYLYDSDSETFVNGDDKISEESIDKSSSQSSVHWEVGVECSFELEYNGFECTVPVTIKESDIASIQYIPVAPYEYKENDTENGEWEYDNDDNRFFWYDTPRIKNGDKLVATLKNGGERVYVYDDESEYFIADEEHKFDYDDIDRSTYQSSNHWKIGSDNYVTITALGKTTKVAVTILCGHFKVVKTEATKPTATKAGNSEYWACTTCGKFFSDANCNNEIAKDSWVIPALGKSKNTMTAKGKKVTVKYAKLKKKTQTIKKARAFAVKKPAGKVTYKLAKKDKKAKNKIKVASNGKITVKKGLKKGTYKITVNVKAAGNASFKPLTKAVVVTIKVK